MLTASHFLVVQRAQLKLLCRRRVVELPPYADELGPTVAELLVPAPLCAYISS